MSRLSERIVQEKAIEHLRLHYNKTKRPETKLYCRDEVVTKDGIRADGFFCFHSEHKLYHVVSLEAKSYKTLDAIVPKWNDRRMLKRISLYSVISMALALSIVYSWKWYWILASLLAILISVFVGCIIYSEIIQPSRHKMVHVYNQISKYPANEQWLAVSSDSLRLIEMRSNQFKQTDQEILRQTCRKRGIGLIIVSRKGVSVDLKPSFKQGEFLENYAIADAIKAAIDQFSTT